MSATAFLKNKVVRGLCAELYIHHSHRLNSLHPVKADIVGACAAPYSVNEAFFEIRLHHTQEIVLHFYWQTGEIASEECDFHEPIFRRERS